MLAVQSCHPEVVEELLAADCDVNPKAGSIARNRLLHLDRKTPSVNTNLYETLLSQDAETRQREGYAKIAALLS